MSLLTIVFLVLGLVLLVLGADWLVRGASGLAVKCGISSLVIGLTVVAYGTSAPELAVSISSAYKNQADLALGNVVGSNIFNVLVILGLCAVVVPLIVHKQLVKFDLWVMIGSSILIYLICLDGKISFLDGIVLFSLAIFYTIFSVLKSRKETKLAAANEEEQAPQSPWFVNVGWIAIGLVALIFGSKWLVDGAVEIARFVGVDELIIGLTIVAAGTSLPEVATSIVAAFKGERDIAVGNVIGSNIFNILTVLGVSSIVSPNGISVSLAAMNFDIPIMIAVAAVCLPVFFATYEIGRLVGSLFFFSYVIYVVYLIMGAKENPMLSTLHGVIIYALIPLAVLGLLILTAKGVRRMRNDKLANEQNDLMTPEESGS